MSRYKVTILPQAEAEFRAAFLWYFERSPVFADALRTVVLEMIDGLERDAHCWPKNDDGVHFRILPKRFKYTIFYDLVASNVTVLAIASQRREPGYWIDRRDLHGHGTDSDA